MRLNSCYNSGFIASMAAKEPVQPKRRVKTGSKKSGDNPIDHPQLREFGSRLRAARKAAGWSLDRLSAESEVHKGDISKIERGKVNATYGTLRKLATAVGMTILLDLLPAAPEKKPSSKP